MANPANTNALILRENAPSIPAESITALTRLDHNRALGQVLLLSFGQIVQHVKLSGKLCSCP